MKIKDYIKHQRSIGGHVTVPPILLSDSQADRKLITNVMVFTLQARTWQNDYDKTTFRLNSKDKFLLI